MLHQISSSGTERFLLAAAVGSSLGFGAGPLFAVVHVPFGGPLPFLGPTCNDPEGCNTGQDFVFNVAIVEEYVAINSGTLTYALPEAVVPEPGTLSMMFSGMLGLGLLVGVKRYRGNRLATIA